MAFKFNGLHLMVDAVVSDSTTLVAPEAGIALLEGIVEKIGMTMILPPTTVKFPHAACEMQRVLDSLKAEGLENSATGKELQRVLRERREEAYGYSTFVMIAESHLTIHTFPELSYFSFDCYSCKGFDIDAVIELIQSCFDVVDISVKSASRGMPAPRNQREAE